MRIRQKLLTAFLFISLLTLGISFGISLTVQQEMVDISQRIGGEQLPGVIALSRMQSETYNIMYLLGLYEKNRSIILREKIEKSLSLLSAHLATHKVFHSKSEQEDETDKFVEIFNRTITRYILLRHETKSVNELKLIRNEIDHLLQVFTDTVVPRITKDLTESYRQIKVIDDINENSRNFLLVSTVAIVLLTIFLSIFIAYRFSRPLQTLTIASKRIGKGKLDLKLPVTTQDEIGELSAAFNVMSSRLLNMRKELIITNQILEKDILEKNQLTAELNIHRENLQGLVLERTQQLEKQRLIAEQANRSKSEFLANMSHEIRTPMNGIIGMMHLTLKSELNEKQKNYIQKAHFSAESLLGIINDILDFSKIESGKMEFESIDFNLQDIINNLHNLIIEKARLRGIHISINIDPDVPNNLIGDPLRLSQVLINLADNAIKFSDKEKPVTVNISVIEKIEHQVKLNFLIQDNGIGLTSQQLDKLFLPFSQADSSTTRKYGGTGLGLIISKNIIEQLGGNISVKSQQGIGSAFNFSVLLGIQQEQRTNNEVAESATVIAVNSAIDSLQGAKVLLVEDNEINMELAMDLLLSIGMTVETAYDGKEALELLQMQDFDGVLMDCQMPVMDGYEATRQIRHQQRFNNLPVIAMTANTLKGDKEKVLAVGMNDHIGKPINPDVMFLTLAKWIKTKKLSNPILTS